MFPRRMDNFTVIIYRRPIIYLLCVPYIWFYVFISTYCMKWAFTEIELPLPHSAEGAGLFRLRVCSHFFQALVGIILRGICTANIYFLSGCFEFLEHRAKLTTSQTSLHFSTIDQFRIPTASPCTEYQGKNVFKIMSPFISWFFL